jgi:polar amino acid transport system substrate-binding protein
MRRVLILSLLVFALILSACGQKAPENHLEAIKQAGVIRVGTSADYPPFEYVDESGNKIGFDIELMEEVAKRLELKLEWVDMPFDSLIAGVQENKIDMAISAFNYSAERDEKVDFTDEYYATEDSFLVADSFTGQIVNPEDVAQYKVGVQSGTVQDDWLTDELIETGLMPEGNLFRYERVDQAALDLKAGRIDVLMSDYLPAEALVAQQGGLKIVYRGQLYSGPMNMVVPEGDQDLAAELNKVIAELKQEGFIQTLAEKYMGLQ